MANRQTIGQRRRSGGRVRGVMERLFLQNKLNNWAGVLIGLFIAATMGFMLARNTFLGLGMFGVALGLGVIIACLLSPTTGFYFNMTYCLIIYQLNRMFFRDELQVGMVIDVLGVSILFGYFIKGVSLKARFNAFARSPIVIFIILNFFYGALELFNPEGHSVVAWGQAIRRALETFVFLFVTYLVLEDKKSVRQYIRYLFVLCVLTALYGCFQQWHGLFNFEREWVMADQIRYGLLYINGEFRKFSTFNDPTAFGAMMAACGVFFLILAQNVQDKTIRRTLLGGVLFMLLGMVYSGTRTANLMFCAGVGMYVLMTFDRKKTRVFAMVAGLLLIGILNAPVYSNYSLNRFRSSFTGIQDESYLVRVRARDYIRPYMLSHPFGGGLATTNNIGLTMNPGHFLAGFQTDSGYLQLALEIGWIGLALICIQFYLVLRRGVRCYFRTNDAEMRPVYVAGVCSIFTYYLGMFAQNTLGHLEDMTFYYPLIAIFLRYNYYENPGHEVPAAG
jgi:putative inorganic carbon (HCO3(-)) transporter